MNKLFQIPHQMFGIHSLDIQQLDIQQLDIQQHTDCLISINDINVFFLCPIVQQHHPTNFQKFSALHQQHGHSTADIQQHTEPVKACLSDRHDPVFEVNIPPQTMSVARVI